MSNNLPANQNQGGQLGPVGADVSGGDYAGGGGFAPSGSVPTMGHTYEDTMAMKDILGKLGAIEETVNPTTASYEAQPMMEDSTPQYTPPGIGGMSGDAQADMKDILSRMYAATEGTTQELLNESQSSPEVKEALNTKRTRSGVEIGNYEIRVRVDESRAKPLNFYDVVYRLSGDVLANDIVLYEAARLLTKYLNNGYTINSPEVKDVLKLEEKYYTNRMDAARFKQRANKAYNQGDGDTGSMFEAKYQNARTHALGAKKRIVEKLG